MLAIVSLVCYGAYITLRVEAGLASRVGNVYMVARMLERESRMFSTAHLPTFVLGPEVSTQSWGLGLIWVAASGECMENGRSARRLC